MHVFKPGAQVFAVGEEAQPVGFLVCHNGQYLQLDAPDEVDFECIRQLLAGSKDILECDAARALVKFGALEEVDAETKAFVESQQSRQIAYLTSFGTLKSAVRTAKALSDSTAIIVGMGGLGCHIAEHLVRTGVRRFALVDDDEVELSNLNRQLLYSAGHVGMPKVEAAAARLREIGATEVNEFLSLDKLVACENVVRSADVAFITADRSPFEIREKLVRELYASHTSYMFAGYNGAVGHIRSAIFRFDQGCGNCLALLSGPKEWLHNLSKFKRYAMAPSGYAMNAVLSAMAVDVWMRSLMNDETENAEFELSLADYSVVRSPVKAISGCPVCGDSCAP